MNDVYVQIWRHDLVQNKNKINVQEKQMTLSLMCLEVFALSQDGSSLWRMNKVSVVITLHSRVALLFISSGAVFSRCGVVQDWSGGVTVELLSFCRRRKLCVRAENESGPYGTLIVSVRVLCPGYVTCRQSNNQ